MPARDKLCVGVNRGPRPNVAIAKFALEGSRDILFLHPHEAPNLVALERLAGQIAKRLILILGADFAGIYQQLGDGVLAHPDQSSNRLHRHPFDHHSEDLGTDLRR